RREFLFALYKSARRQYVGKHHTWTAENVILQSNALIDGDIVLNFAAVADRHIWTDHHVLANGATFADAAVTENVAEMPNLRLGPDSYGSIDDRRRMNEGRLVGLRFGDHRQPPRTSEPVPALRAREWPPVPRSAALRQSRRIQGSA